MLSLANLKDRFKSRKKKIGKMFKRLSFIGKNKLPKPDEDINGSSNDLFMGDNSFYTTGKGRPRSSVSNQSCASFEELDDLFDFDILENSDDGSAYHDNDAFSDISTDINRPTPIEQKIPPPVQLRASKKRANKSDGPKKTRFSFLLPHEIFKKKLSTFKSGSTNSSPRLDKKSLSRISIGSLDRESIDDIIQKKTLRATKSLSPNLMTKFTFSPAGKKRSESLRSKRPQSDIISCLDLTLEDEDDDVFSTLPEEPNTKPQDLQEDQELPNSVFTDEKNNDPQVDLIFFVWYMN